MSVITRTTVACQIVCRWSGAFAGVARSTECVTIAISMRGWINLDPIFNEIYADCGRPSIPCGAVRFSSRTVTGDWRRRNRALRV